MPRIAEYTFTGCSLRFETMQGTDESGEEKEITMLLIEDPGEPAMYKLAFTEEVRKALLTQLQQGIVPADVADIRKLTAERGGLARG